MNTPPLASSLTCLSLRDGSFPPVAIERAAILHTGVLRFLTARPIIVVAVVVLMCKGKKKMLPVVWKVK